jgi:methylphosphotriester-DNA--protein-cysteine methyltransferase
MIRIRSFAVEFADLDMDPMHAAAIARRAAELLPETLAEAARTDDAGARIASVTLRVPATAPAQGRDLAARIAGSAARAISGGELRRG